MGAARSDAKLVVLGLMINPDGFIKYSSILEGNMADSKTLEGMIGKLRIKTSVSARKALIVIDAGIATDGNMKMILDNDYDYLLVSRSGLKEYTIEAGAATVSVTDNRKQKIELCRGNSDRNTDYYYLKVELYIKLFSIWIIYVFCTVFDKYFTDSFHQFRVIRSDVMFF